MSQTPTDADAAAARRPGLPGRLIDALLFRHMSIRSKVLLFSVGVSFWFLVIGGASVAAAPSRTAAAVVVVSVVLAHVLLVVFARSITSSITAPIDSIIHTIRALTRGDMASLERIVVASGDEIGELSARFNVLLDTLHELNTFKRVIEEDDTADDVYERLSAVFTANGLPRHRIYEVGPDGRSFRVRAARGDDRAWCNPEVMVDCRLCRAKRTSREVEGIAYPSICTQFALEGEAQHHCIPFIIGGTTGGVVQFLFDPDEVARPAEVRARVEVAHRYLREALPVLEAKRLTETLRDSVMRDALTGLFNRRFLEEQHARIVALADRRETGLGLLMCDLDRFKGVNDRYGHAIGDIVLKEVAGIILESVRDGDVVVRYGGEEFLAVLLDVDEEGAVRVAERIRAAVEERTIREGTIVIRTTLSVGVACFPGDASGFWECVNAADSALYEAKEGGRNRVVRFVPSRPCAERGVPDEEDAGELAGPAAPAERLAG